MGSHPSPGPGIPMSLENPGSRLFGTSGLARFLRWLFALLLIAALGGAAYGGYWYAERRFQLARMELAQVAETLKRDVDGRVAELSERVGKAEQSAASAGLLVQGPAGQVPLEQRLNEIDAMRDTLSRTQAALEQRLEDVQRTVAESLTRQQRAADATLASRLARQNRLLQAQSHATRALADLAAGNWGLAREGLRPIPALLQALDAPAVTAQAGAPGDTAQPAPVEAVQAEQVTALLRLVNEARVALAGESSSAPELVRMVWVRISELITTAEAVRG